MRKEDRRNCKTSWERESMVMKGRRDKNLEKKNFEDDSDRIHAMPCEKHRESMRTEEEKYISV